MATESQQQAEPDVTGAGATFEMPPDPPADTGDDADPAAGQPAGDKPTRAARRAERASDFAARTSAAEARAAAAEQRAQANEVALAELRGRVTAGESQRQQNAPDPYAARLAAARTKISSAVARMGSGDANAEAEWHAAEEERQDIIAERAADVRVSRATKDFEAKIPQPVDPDTLALTSEFRFLTTNEHARAVANGYVAQLVALEGRDMKNPEIRQSTLREAAAHAASVLKLGGSRPKPTDVDRDRVSGTSGRDTGAGNGPVKVHLNGDQMKMAQRLFRDLPPEQAHQKWWKEIGSKIEKK